MKTINIDLPEDVARRYLEMSPSEKLSVSKELIRILENKRGLLDIMDDMSDQAKKKWVNPRAFRATFKGRLIASRLRL